ncbi:glycosyltransferase family 4 protein [Cecembia rubra]|uniref:glycosyltransferase family 4 protein n=1 Tax=Cecembia rubra TaxID=1485585 RepID=UPI001473F072|nr:glycosyltransferase family 4 protein [Cecembia rubra]
MKSVLETLEPLLGEFCEVKTASSQKNQGLRFADMVFHFFRYGLSSDKIIIDVYSTLAFQYAFILGILAHIFGKPYVLSLHGGNLPNRYQVSSKKVKWLFNRACHIIAPSHYLADFFNQQGFQVQVIPNIIPLSEYPYYQRKSIRPRILAIRGFGNPYNPLMTLKAVHLLKDQVQDLKVLMLGNPEEPHYPEVMNFIYGHGLEGIVEVRPKMPKNEWIALSKDYDIMVSNPLIDNTPISLIEGMALGMCVVSTKVGGVPYLVSEKECALVDSDDATGLSQAILSILQDAGYAQQLSRNSREKAEEFDWENIKPLWMKILTES